MIEIDIFVLLNELCYIPITLKEFFKEKKYFLLRKCEMRNSNKSFN